MTTHRTDLLSLFAGLLFVAVGLVALIGGMGSLLEGQWLVPGALVVLGIGVLLTATSNGQQDKTRAMLRGDSDRSETNTTETPGTDVRDDGEEATNDELE